MTQPKPHSRLLKLEQKKTVRQSVFLLILSVGILITFLLFGLPLFFSLFLKLFGGADNLTGNQFPPQVPVLSAPISATNSARLSLTGFTEASAEVVVVRNGEQIETLNADDQGKFEAVVQLEKGENKLATFAKRGEQESELSKMYSVILDTDKPKLEISEPQENQEFRTRSEQLITIKGVTDPNAKILLNGRLVFPNSDGLFSTTFQLQEGENVLTFISQDEAMNETKTERKVKYSL